MIDWNRVTELRDEIGADDFREVVDLFLDEVDEVIDRMTATPDPKKYASDFHFLKGSAVNLGFDTFATICAEEEDRFSKGSTEPARTVEAFESYKASRKELMAYLEGLEEA